MNPWQSYVDEMFDLSDAPEHPVRGQFASPEFAQLCIDLIDEEVNRELIPALRREDLVETLDGACDAIWVILWAVRALGFDLTPFMEEVARSNLDKVQGEIVRNEAGKIMKPPGWSPPDITGVLARQMRDEEARRLHQEVCERIPYDGSKPRPQ